MTTTLVGDGTQRWHLTAPSFVGSGRLDELRRLRGGIDSAELADDEFALEHGGQSYFTGRLAVEQCSDATAQRGDVERYWNRHTLRLLLAQVAGLVRDRDLVIRVVTGLPVALWSRDAMRQVQRSLIGTHAIRLNGRDRTVTIDSVAVLMEGAGAVIAYGKSGDMPQYVADIGGRTTDLFKSHGMKPVIDRCVGYPVGVEKAGDLLNEVVAERFGRTLLPDERQRILRAFASRSALPTIYASGQPINFNGLVESAVQRVGDEILSFVSQHWRVSDRSGIASDAGQVLLVGGGAHYFQSLFQSAIPHLAVPPVPELANAEGYLKFGQRMKDQQWHDVRPQ